MLRSEEQYSDLLAWVARRAKVKLTDDRGDSFIVRLLEFSPSQSAAPRNRLAPWRMTYTVRALIFEETT